MPGGCHSKSYGTPISPQSKFQFGLRRRHKPTSRSGHQTWPPRTDPWLPSSVCRFPARISRIALVVSHNASPFYSNRRVCYRDSQVLARINGGPPGCRKGACALSLGNAARRRAKRAMEPSTVGGEPVRRRRPSERHRRRLPSRRVDSHPHPAKQVFGPAELSCRCIQSHENSKECLKNTRHLAYTVALQHVDVRGWSPPPEWTVQLTA